MKTIQGLKSCFIAGALWTLAACNSGGSSPAIEESIPTSTEVAIQLFTDFAMTEAFTNGATIYLYNGDTQTIDRTVEIGESGEAVLGHFEETLSMSLVYRAKPSVGASFRPIDSFEYNELNIRSLLNLPLHTLEREGERSVLKLRTSNTSFPQPEWVTGLSLTARTTSVPTLPSSSSDTIIPNNQPLISPNSDYSTTINGKSYRGGSSSYQLLDGAVVIDNLRLSASQADDNGLVSFLSTIESRNGRDLLQYGFSLDQALSPDSNYQVDMELFPVEVPVDTEALRETDYVSVYPSGILVDTHVFGERNGIEYTLSPRHSFLIGSGQSRGNQAAIFVADEFPVESYLTEVRYYLPSQYSAAHRPSDAHFFSAGGECLRLSESSTRPQELLIGPPQTDYLSLTFDLSNQQFAWEQRSPEAIQWQTLSLQPLSQSPQFRSALWTIEFKQTDSVLKLPALPTELFEEVKGLLLLPSQSVRITGYDHMPSLNSPLTLSDKLKPDAGPNIVQCSRDEAAISAIDALSSNQ